MKALADEGVTVLLTTQYLEEADRLADRIAVIDHGRVVAEGTAEELKARVGGETLELFFADPDGRDARTRAGPPRRRLSLRVAVGGAEDVRRVLDAVDGVERPLELHRPSLDDVFLALT